MIAAIALQIDVLEDPSITNVIVLQTVLDEVCPLRQSLFCSICNCQHFNEPKSGSVFSFQVKHRSATAYKRTKDAVGTSEKHFYTFVNEFHK